MKKKLIIGIVSIIAVIALIVMFSSGKKQVGQVTLETAIVKKGNVSNVITATGTLEALRTISVGTQVSGIVNKIFVDYNSHVKAGQLLAELDKQTLITSLKNAEANLENAKAEVTYQTANYGRIKALADKNLVAQNEYDQAIYNYTKANATLKTAELEYNRAKINLGYASIYSPIDGVILERAVDEGQTVAASFSTPTLFSIANDLKQMQVEVSIDETDIGKVKGNQRVTFTVDAFPDMVFNGKVIQIRFQPVTKSNVVTYTVVVEAQNPDLKLMPGMTASITVFVEEATNVLMVSSKAIHFTPSQEELEALMKKPGINKEQAEMPTENPDEIKIDSLHKIVWIKKNNGIFPIPVKTGIDDDLNVQILEGLNEGDEVVIAINSATTAPTFGTQGQTGGSPFMPKPPTRSKSTNTNKKS